MDAAMPSRALAPASAGARLPTPTPTAPLRPRPRERAGAAGRATAPLALLLALPATCLAGGASAHRGRRGAARRPRRTAAVPRCSRGGEAIEAQVLVPTDLYQLLGVGRRAGPDEIKKAYRSKLKISHPDVAGEESSELMILLNDAYRVLSDPGERTLYDETIGKRDPSKPKVEVCSDLGPTWTRSVDALKDQPVWAGTPRSVSKWDRRPPSERGEMWKKQMFAYVDPYCCISCQNCAEAAPKTFCMNAKNGKAKAFAQWGDAECEITWAIESCPVDCITWVNREDLQCLEHVTAKRLHETNNYMECAMQMRQGTISSGDDPFLWAEQFKKDLRRAEARESSKTAASADERAAALEKRIQKVFDRLRPELKLMGWPAAALPPGIREL